MRTRRPKGTSLINADFLEGTSGVWGDAKDCQGDVSKLTGPLTNLTGNISALDGHVHEGLVGDASNLRGSITGLRGNIGDLDWTYTFNGHGGDLSALSDFESYWQADHEFTRKAEEEIVILLVHYFLSPDDPDTYDPDTFISIVESYDLEPTLFALVQEIQDVERITIPDDVLMALTS